MASKAAHWYTTRESVDSVVRHSAGVSFTGLWRQLIWTRRVAGRMQSSRSFCLRNDKTYTLMSPARRYRHFNDTCTSLLNQQGVALMGRNTTGPPHAAPWWVNVAYASVTDDRRRLRQTPATVSSLPSYTMYRRASNNILDGAVNRCTPLQGNSLWKSKKHFPFHFIYGFAYGLLSQWSHRPSHEYCTVSCLNVSLQITENCLYANTKKTEKSK